MSKTKIPDEVRTRVIDAHRDRRGNIRCAHCSKVVAKGGFDLDHIVPEMESTPELRADPRNLQVLCSRKKTDPAGWGCHQRKSAAEARRWAQMNREPVPWTKVLVTGGLGVLGVGYCAASIVPNSSVSPEGVLVAGGAVLVGALGTILVKNGFTTAAPLEKIPAQPESDPAPRLDLARAHAAVREVVGARGEVKVTSKHIDAAQVTYSGTGFDDSKEGDGRAAFLAKWSAKMGGRWRATWETTKDTVWLVRRPQMESFVPHPGLRADRPWHVLPFAGTRDEPVSFDLMVTSHLLIIGVTNMGKTSMMRSIIAALCDSARRGEVELTLADPKRIELLGFKGWPGVRQVVTDPIALWDMAIDLEEEMNRRYTLAEEQGVPLSSHKRLVVVIDEFEQYFKRMRRLWQNGDPTFQGKPTDDPYKKKTGQVVPPPIDAIQSVLSMARRCGIHVIIGTQSPDATWFGGSGTRENMQGRAAVGPIDGIRARMAFGDSSIGVDLPPEAKGRTTLQVGEGQADEVQAWWTPDPRDTDGTNTDQDWAILARLGMERA